MDNTWVPKWENGKKSPHIEKRHFILRISKQDPRSLSSDFLIQSVGFRGGGLYGYQKWAGVRWSESSDRMPVTWFSARQQSPPAALQPFAVLLRVEKQLAECEPLLDAKRIGVRL